MAGTCHVRLTALCLIVTCPHVVGVQGPAQIHPGPGVTQFRRRAPSPTKTVTSMFKRRDVICLLARTQTDAQSHARVRSCRADGHVNPHASLEAQGKCKCFPLPVCDMPSSGRRAFACEHVEETEKRGIQGGEMAPIPQPLVPPDAFLFPFWNMVAKLQQGLETSQENVAQAPFSPSILPLVFRDTTNVRQHPPPLSPSFVILISESHVAPPASSGCESRESRILRKRRRAGSPP